MIKTGQSLEQVVLMLVNGEKIQRPTSEPEQPGVDSPQQSPYKKPKVPLTAKRVEIKLG